MAASMGFPPLAAACFAAAAGALLLLSLLPQAAAANCVYQGKPYTGGSSFPAGDGCNVCSCNAQTGSVGCTKAVCRCTNDSQCGTQWCSGGYCTPRTGAGGSCTYPNAAKIVAKCRAGLTCLGASATKNGVCGSCMYAGKVYQRCRVSTDCDANEFCSAGSCKARLAPGATCPSTECCTRGLRCIEGVCASCEYHNSPKQAGQMWYERCNVCKCQAGGSVTCTRNDCTRAYTANAKATGNRKLSP
eukprot:jgi/Chlat1/3779/Chrsp259S03916